MNPNPVDLYKLTPNYPINTFGLINNVLQQSQPLDEQSSDSYLSIISIDEPEAINRPQPTPIKIGTPFKYYTKLDCMICGERAQNDQTLRLLPCQHIFHCDCIDKWLTEYNKNCPVCRQAY